MLRAVSIVFIGLLLVAPSTGVAQQPTAEAPARVAEAWPDAAALSARREAAERLPLFSTHEPLAFTLIADFNVVQRDRNELSTTTYPATLVVAKSDGGDASLPVRIRTRGHSRRNPNTCDFAPLRVEFPANPIGTPFENQEHLKLGTHCRDTEDYEQYVLREFAVYRLHNLLTPTSFRARLATARYVNVKNQKTVATRAALFLEDSDDMAARLGGRAIDQYRVSYRNAEPHASMMMAIFAFMIGNTDMSMMGLHNVVLVSTPAGALIPVAYDFDYAGIVSARYAHPDPRLRLRSVRFRAYRGPCRTADDFKDYLTHFRNARPDLEAVYDLVPDLGPAYRREARGYLDEFFKLIDDTPKFDQAVNTGCLDGM